VEGHRALITRRQFASAALVGLNAKAERNIAGGFVNDGFTLGHRLRDRTLASNPKQIVRIPVVIVGGGIAGLSAAWRLDKRGFRDFVLLEMEREAGGNSRSGQNEITAYPWAAHYIPVPPKSAVLVRELMEDLGVLRDGEWDERYLCYSPQERLFLHGRWQEDVEPSDGATAKDRDQMKRFHERIRAFARTGQFTVPMEVGARASALDRASMRDWMRENGFDSPYLNWYVNYACRDEYGGAMHDISAWAGVYYFAAHDEHDDKGPITQSDGNGWIVKRLVEKLKRHIRTGSPVVSVVQQGRKVNVSTPDTTYVCDTVVFAAPMLLAKYLLESPPPVTTQYSPWVTANITLDRMPRERGIDLAWDNVIFQSQSLGYVAATHMSLRSRTERSVWTWYMALSEGSPQENRAKLLQQSWEHWRDYILADLQRAHPDIRECVSRIDVMRIGHAMARPVPGSIFSERRARLTKPHGRILFAHSDVSGFSVFEEAQYRGVRAADRVLGEW
jgi:glycine/D-amino acid oxidase-like deaminating enzyme